jgi:hypothetical protein
VADEAHRVEKEALQRSSSQQASDLALLPAAIRKTLATTQEFVGRISAFRSPCASEPSRPFAQGAGSRLLDVYAGHADRS